MNINHGFPKAKLMEFLYVGSGLLQTDDGDGPHNIGFPGQIRKFDNQTYFNFIQIRQILSCRENYHSYSFSYHSI